MLGETANRKCLDVGSDNGVISFLLRKEGGNWSSADLDDTAVASITELVKDNVYQLDEHRTGFKDDEFDTVVIVDYLEHIHNDSGFIEEVYRILKPGGELLINVPHTTNSLLRKFRLTIGQTDEKHGHLRPGYKIQDIAELVAGKFEIQAHSTYSRFFSETIDTLVTFGYGLVKKDSGEQNEAQGTKGVLVTSSDMGKYKKAFKLYSAIYPIVWLFGKLDGLLFLSKGYMMIVKAKSTKTVMEASVV
ncbi:MAG: class I SAM-dependent methyltransferase [bacterium]